MIEEWKSVLAVICEVNGVDLEETLNTHGKGSTFAMSDARAMFAAWAKSQGAKQFQICDMLNTGRTNGYHLCYKHNNLVGVDPRYSAKWEQVMERIGGEKVEAGI